MVCMARHVPPPKASATRRTNLAPEPGGREEEPGPPRDARKAAARKSTASAANGRLSDNTNPTYGGASARHERHPPFASPSRSSRLARPTSRTSHPSPRDRIHASE